MQFFTYCLIRGPGNIFAYAIILIATAIVVYRYHSFQESTKLPDVMAFYPSPKSDVIFDVT